MKRRIIAGAAIALWLSAPLGSALAQEGGNSQTPTQQHKLTKLPKLVHFQAAEFPPEKKKAAEDAKFSGTMASVTLQIAIDDTGKVEDAIVLQSAGADFDAAALAAVKQFRFSPAEIDNKPAPVKITYRYDFVIKYEPPTPAINYEGEVKNRFTKKPIPGVTIKLEGVGEVTTDDSGHFQFRDVPLGKHVVTISGPGLTTVSTEEAFEKGKKLSVKYALEPKEEVPPGEESDLEIVVVAPKIQKEVVSTEIKVEEGRRVPGTQGDTLKVVQNLPGVARASFGSGQLVVWGAAPQDTRVYVDGVHIPLLYHGGGLRSTINSDLVRAIELSPGGYGSEYGGGLGGLVTIDTRTLRADKVHGYVAADVIDASGMIEMPIDKSTRIAVTGRKSYLDRTLKLATSTDVSEFIPIPDYYDAQLKLTHDLRQNESVTLLGLIARDTLTRTVDSPDPDQVKTQDNLTTFNRIAIRYQRQLADGSTISAMPWFGHDHFATRSTFGPTPAVLDTSGNVYGFRASWRGKATEHSVVTLGLDVEASRYDVQRQGSVTLPAREGDPSVFGQPPGDSYNVDNWQTTLASVAPWAQADFAFLGDRLHVVPGVRVAPYVTGASRQTPKQGATPSIGITTQRTALEPRLSVRYQLDPRLGLKAAFGIYHQSPQAEDLSAVFGNPTLNVEKAYHLLGGVNVKLTDELSLEEVVFFSKSSDLVTRSASPVPKLAAALVQEGEGRAYGAQVLLRQELAKGFFGWVSYTLMRAERRDHPGDSWRLFDYDQTHVATVLASYELGKGWEIGGRFRYATGFPRTPVIGSSPTDAGLASYVSGTRRDLTEPVFGTQNTTRVPAFVQADARLAKHFTLSWGKIEAYLDVQNITNRSNPEEIAYDYRYKNRQYITGLPLLPVVGARMEW